MRQALVGRAAAGFGALAASKANSNGADFVTDTAHKNLIEAISTHASQSNTAQREALGEILKNRNPQSGQERQDMVLDCFRLISENPEVVARFIAAAAKDLEEGHNGHQMLRYVLNTSYETGTWARKEVQGAAREVLGSKAVTDASTLQKFLAVMEDYFEAGALSRILRHSGLTTGAIYEAAVANSDLEDGATRRVIDNFIKSNDPKVDQTAKALLMAKFDKKDEESYTGYLKYNLEQQLPVKDPAISSMKKALGLEDSASLGATLYALVHFRPEANLGTQKAAEVHAQAVKVLQAGMRALMLDRENGRTVYELSITSLYNPELGNTKHQIWKSPAVQRQMAKNLVALADYGHRTGEMAPFVKTLTWYEGTLTAQQVFAILKRDNDPSVVHELLISENIDLSRQTHRDRLETFASMVENGDKFFDAKGRLPITDNHRVAASMIRKAIADFDNKNADALSAANA